MAHEKMDKKNPQRQRKSHRRSVSLTWLLLAVLVSVAVSVGACALFLPDRSPSLLSGPEEITSAAVQTQEYSGTKQVSLVPSMTTDREILGNTSGVVTADYSGAGLNSGTAALKVNDRVVVALNTATPLYRNLKSGDEGDDVLALNNELNRLGYSSAPESRTYSWYTQEGWKQLMFDSGNDSDGNLSLPDVLWIPESSVQISSWTGTIGSNISMGTPLGVVPGALVKLEIKNGQPSSSDQILNFFGQNTTLPAGAIAVEDQAFCQQIADTAEFKSAAQGDMSAGLDATLSLPEPIEVLRVPAAAVFGIADNQGCVVSEGRTIPVSIVGSELGASLVQPQNDIAVESIDTVALGTLIAGARCS